MKKIIVTTTSTIDGLTIQNYFDPISETIVVGANLFSDISASFTDLFGGRSNTYETKLQQIYEQAIVNLKKKAEVVGANCIVGVKTDINEISGKGNQMFMITAYGTPVMVYSSAQKSEHVIGRNIDGSLVDRKIKAQELLTINTNPINIFTDTNIQFIVSSKLPELKDLVLKGIKFLRSPDAIVLGVDEANKRAASLGKYFDIVDTNLAIEVLYKEFHNDNTTQYLQFISEVIINYNLVDYSKVKDLISSSDFTTAKLGLLIVSISKSYYTTEDRVVLEELPQLIDDEFKIVGEKSTKKKLLSSSEKEVWNCTCGKVNDIDVQYCGGCEKDIYGFEKNDVKPQNVINLIKSRLLVMKELGI